MPGGWPPPRLSLTDPVCVRLFCFTYAARPNPQLIWASGALFGTSSAALFALRRSKSLSRERRFRRGRDTTSKVVLEVRREPKLTHTELTQAKWTRCRRQQQIDMKSESNTKSCVLPANAGDNGCETAVSIEPSAGPAKPFSWRAGVGLYSSGHDGKMTQNGDCRPSTQKLRCETRRGQSGEKPA